MARQAYSLDVLVAECNTHAPNRSKVSDGGLGDPAHAARVSDHNPNEAGVWRARDITDDPPELDGSDLFHRIHNLMREGHPALKSGAYLIHNSQIVSYDRLAEGLRPYDGENAHTKHVHVSVSTAAAGYDSRTPWNLWAESTPKPVAPTPAAIPTIEDIRVALQRLADQSANPKAARDYLEARDDLGPITGGNRTRVPTKIEGVRAALRSKLESDDLPPGHRRRIQAAYDLIRGI